MKVFLPGRPVHITAGNGAYLRLEPAAVPQHGIYISLIHKDGPVRHVAQDVHLCYALIIQLSDSLEKLFLHLFLCHILGIKENNNMACFRILAGMHVGAFPESNAAVVSAQELKAVIHLAHCIIRQHPLPFEAAPDTVSIHRVHGRSCQILDGGLVGIPYLCNGCISC